MIWIWLLKMRAIAAAAVTNFRLREGGGTRLRQDGSKRLRQ